MNEEDIPQKGLIKSLKVNGEIPEHHMDTQINCLSSMYKKRQTVVDPE